MCSLLLASFLEVLSIAALAAMAALRSVDVMVDSGET